MKIKFSVPSFIEKTHQVVVPVEGPYNVAISVHAGDIGNKAGIEGFLAAFGIRGVLYLTDSYPIKKLFQLFETGIEIPDYSESSVVESIINTLSRQGVASLAG